MQENLTSFDMTYYIVKDRIIFTEQSRSMIRAGAGMSQICPRFKRGRHENGPPGDLFDQPPGEMS